jgi:HNH endonuclease
MEARARRDAYLVQSVGGTYLGTMTLDAISGTIVATEHQRLERTLFESDWAEAKERLGREPLPHELERTSAQRRADAFVEMATRSATAPAGGRRPAPLFSVLVDFPTLSGRICQLANNTVVTPGSLLPWIEEADIERAVFTPGRRIECSETSRLFTGATRRAIELRDRECQHPYCDVPADRCQADHIIEYSKGGLTTQENGRLLCGHHNRQGDQRPPPPELE